MASKRTKAFAAVGVVMSLSALAACGGGGNNNSSSPGGGAGTNGTSPGTPAATKGGTLTYYTTSATEHTDPQRMYIGRDLTNFSRTVYRSLVAFPISSDPKTSTTPVPDLATDTGKSSDNAHTWTFTIKNNVTWQDGKPVTCEDFKYGASRVFATDVITGGPNYLLTYLNIPDGPDGLPTYKGPYVTKNNDVAAFNKAITCQGQTITYHFKQPWPDFPLAIAALHMMDPFRKDKDQGDKSNYQIFSNGPYELQGTWNKETGGTFVRNPNYNPASDSTDIRKALPDQIVFNIGKQPETIAEQLIADNGPDQAAVTSQSIPPSKYTQIVGAVADRTVNVQSPFVDYLQLNFNTTTANPAIRRALSVSTNDAGWITAGGGSKAYSPARSIVNPAVQGYQPNPAFPRPTNGDPAAAKKILQQAGVQTPVKLTFTYPSTSTMDKMAAILQQTWKQAGLDVTLDGVSNQDTYYTNIQSPSNKADIIWAGWGADWPSAITVIPPLFDSRINLTKTSVGQDYGQYHSDVVNSLITKARNAANLNDQTKFLQQADIALGKDVAYIPMEISQFYMLRGSKVAGYMTTAASNGYPDLGPIGVQQ